MAIYRGIGGAGDSTTDATITDVTEQATNAAASASAAATSATNAANSESNALTYSNTATTKASQANTSANNAATSESNAAASASAASTSETNAATSETNAATSESNAATSEANAAASYDDFDDRYLGAKASAPSVDNDGDALVTGALYFNTAASKMQVYTGTAWGNLEGADGFTEVNDLTAAVTWANVPDANITQSSVTQHQAALSITESQISDLGSYITASSTDTLTNKSGNISQWTNDSSYLTTVAINGISDVVITTPADNEVLAYDNTSGNWINQTASEAGLLTTEVNDLTATVTWANVPDANITQSSVTQHQAALSITESQISDLGTYLEAGDTAATLTVTTLTSTTANITTVDLGNWTITESSGVLYFATGGVNKMKLDASGNLTVVGDVTAYGTI